MPRYLKRGMDASAIKAADAKVRETVEHILAEIEARKDVAVRELSQKFDNWSPASFKLTPPRSSARSGRCESAISTTSSSRRRRCAISRRSRATRCAISKSRRCPASSSATGTSRSNSIGCYVPGGRYPMVASAHMSIVTARVAGVKRIIACAPPFKGGPHPAIVAAMHFGGADEIFVLGGVQAVAAMALGTETIAAGRHDRRARQRLCGRGQAATVRPRRHRSARRPDRDAGHRRRHASTAKSAPPICSARPSTGRPRRRSSSPIRRSSRATPWREVERLLKILPTADARRQGLGGFRRGHRLRRRGRDGARGRSHRLRARPGDDARSGLFPQQHEELRLAVPRPAHQRRLRRQGDRHQPHAADQEGGALHRRAVGRQIPQDLHLSEGADRRRPAP